jgi:AraC-like DNA-binding protein
MAAAAETNAAPQMRSISLHNYVEVTRFLGVDPYPLMKQAKVHPDDLLDPESRVAAAAVAMLYREAALASGFQSFGLLMAECRSFASLGPISLLLKHQPTARDVLQMIVEHVRMFNDILDVNMSEQDGAALIRCNYRPGYSTRHLLELAVALTYRSVSEIMAGRWRAECIHFRHSAPRDLSTHRRVFACPVQFDSEFDGISCASASLDLPNPSCDPQLARHARHFIAMLESNRPKGSVGDRARHSIYLLLPSGNATLQRVADNLALHPRMLQRLLVQEGSSFGVLLNEIRHELALRHLTDSNHSIGEIAMMLGYATLGSFTRRFTQEFGKSPAAWRKADGAEAESARRQLSAA